jgi:hypothetical protein
LRPSLYRADSWPASAPQQLFNRLQSLYSIN